jgi:hypothetical protein
MCSARIPVSRSDDFEKIGVAQKGAMVQKTAKLLANRTVRPLASGPVEPFAAGGDDVYVRKQAS